ncbi:hypothetical protein L917_19045 [Phytophthora nicotianae]|uniref:Uncharacterized protein n=1 Tax=Phytophthora nicotianae TaxID=4792 RepID=W2K7S8_PHYNI|nr:hypothetical protein L917_19045 [Phytophthora nicotianae]
MFPKPVMVVPHDAWSRRGDRGTEGRKRKSHAHRSASRKHRCSTSAQLSRCSWSSISYKHNLIQFMVITHSCPTFLSMFERAVTSSVKKRKPESGCEVNDAPFSREVMAHDDPHCSCAPTG